MSFIFILNVFKVFIDKMSTLMNKKERQELKSLALTFISGFKSIFSIYFINKKSKNVQNKSIPWCIYRA